MRPDERARRFVQTARKPVVRETPASKAHGQRALRISLEARVGRKSRTRFTEVARAFAVASLTVLAEATTKTTQTRRIEP